MSSRLIEPSRLIALLCCMSCCHIGSLSAQKHFENVICLHEEKEKGEEEEEDLRIDGEVFGERARSSGPLHFEPI